MSTDDWGPADYYIAASNMGYGHLMHAAARVWRDNLARDGMEGCALTVGPCATFTVRCGCRSHDAGIARLLDENGHCDWCCGCGWVTERVRVAQRVVMEGRKP